MTDRVPATVYFKLLWLGGPAPPFTSIPNLDPDICIPTNTAPPPPDQHLSTLPLPPSSSFPSNPVFFSINYSCIIQAFPMEINTGAIH